MRELAQQKYMMDGPSVKRQHDARDSWRELCQVPFRNIENTMGSPKPPKINMET